MESLFNYISYRKYLSEYYAWHKKNGYKISYRSFASEAGVRFTNFLPSLIDGERNLTEKQLPGVIGALNLNSEEANYFKLLVHFDQAKMQEEREHLFGEIASIRADKSIEKIEENRYAYYSNWAAVAIRELLNVIEYNPKDEEGYYRLGSMLRPRISRKDARAAVMLLMDLEMVTVDEQGILRLTSQQITTGDEAPGFYIKEYYRQMHQRASDSMDLFTSDQRELSGISMSVSDETLQKIKSSIQNFRKEIETLVSLDENDPERLIQLNVQMFPLAEIPNED